MQFWRHYCLEVMATDSAPDATEVDFQTSCSSIVFFSEKPNWFCIYTAN